MKFIALHARENNDQKRLTRLLSKEYVLCYLFLSGLSTRFAELKKPIGEKADMSVKCWMISIAVSAWTCRELSISHRSPGWSWIHHRQEDREKATIETNTSTATMPKNHTIMRNIQPRNTRIPTEPILHPTTNFWDINRSSSWLRSCESSPSRSSYLNHFQLHPQTFRGGSGNNDKRTLIILTQSFPISYISSS